MNPFPCSLPERALGPRPELGLRPHPATNVPLVTLLRLKVLVTAPTQTGGREMTVLMGTGYAHRAVEEGEEVVVTHRPRPTLTTAKDVKVTKTLMKRLGERGGYFVRR